MQQYLLHDVTLIVAVRVVERDRDRGDDSNRYGKSKISIIFP